MLSPFTRILYYNGVAFGLFILGLVSPLTPSAGVPKTLDILLFVGVPVLLASLAWGLSQNRVQKFFSFATLAGILLIASVVLIHQFLPPQ